MATAHAFGNMISFTGEPGESPVGCYKVGNLSVPYYDNSGNLRLWESPEGIVYYMGADEEINWTITHTTGSIIGIWRYTGTHNVDGFLEFANSKLEIPTGESKTDGSELVALLHNAGFWTSYVPDVQSFTCGFSTLDFNDACNKFTTKPVTHYSYKTFSTLEENDYVYLDNMFTIKSGTGYISDGSSGKEIILGRVGNSTGLCA